jgi:hypothetical protein
MNEAPGARFESMARGWEETSFETPADPSRLLAATLYLWIQSSGARKEGVSDRLREYTAALWGVLDKKWPGWYDSQFDDHDYCGVCGERYRWENLSLCTDCGAAYCPSHRHSGGPAPNGNDRCVKCGMGEIVG